MESVLDPVLDLERSLRDVLAELKEWGDMRVVIRKLEDLINSQRELKDSVERRVSGENEEQKN